MLPGVVPRLRAFAADGFGWIALLMASIYAAVGLLPAGHPYLSSANKGRFGMRHVILAAGRNLVFDRRHVDQIIIYFVLLTGFVLVLAQIALLALSLVFHPAIAGPPFLSLFITPAPVTNDVAYMLLDRVFAVPDMFGSKFDPAIIGTTPFSLGLHALFKFYSQAMLIVGVFILLYYIVILVAETAQSGTPFGKRFDSVWAPIRLVVAIGLLVPINFGYNSAQYIVLYSAKFGSSFATNAWNVYNNSVTGAGATCTVGGADNAIGWCNESLVSVPRTQDVMHLVQFMTLARSCKVAYETIYRSERRRLANGNETFGRPINPYLVRQTATGSEFRQITAGPAPTWQEAVEFYNYGDILIVFGHQHENHTKATGTVQPYCGEIVVPTTDVSQEGAKQIQNMYYAMILTMWEDARFEEFAKKANAMHIDKFMQDPSNCGAPAGGTCGPCSVEISVGDVGACNNGRNNEFPTGEFGQQLKTAYYLTSDAILQAGRQTMINSTDFTVTAKMRERGWGGAGIWYNQIAEWNGSLFSAAINIPTPKSMPLVMKEIESQKAGTDQNMPSCQRYEPYLASKDRAAAAQLDPNEIPVAKMLSDVYQYWRCKNPTEKTENKASGNVFVDTMSAIFGLNGLFTIRENPTTHPMALLSGIGRSIVESAIRNLMAAMTFSFLGGMVEIMDMASAGTAYNMMSGFFVTLTTMGLSIGFILYYVLPFLPFMYFFFAVGSWIKAIFEAMVGVPLWALAHLRIDGTGIHGDTALSGYFLIFEIFVRPILTVFGLLASMAIFGALVKTLNGIFPMVTSNLTGFDINAPKASSKILGIEFNRGIIDQFFFTVIYTVIVYMIGLSAFKMIDLVPNNILRWMGGNAHSFSENNEGNINQFIQYAAIGGATMTQKAAGAATAGARVAGNAVGIIPGMLSRAVGNNASSQARGAPGKTKSLTDAKPDAGRDTLSGPKADD